MHVIIGSANGLLLLQRQAIFWTNGDLMSSLNNIVDNL